MNAYTSPVLPSCWMCQRSEPVPKLAGVLDCYKDPQKVVRVTGPEADECGRFLAVGEGAA